MFAYAVAAPPGAAFRPRGAAINDGQVFVADSDGARLAVLDIDEGAQAGLVFIPVAAGRSEEAPSQPTSVVFALDQTLLVADPANGRIRRLTHEGTFLGDFLSERERARSNLVRPVGLALFQNELYVTDVQDQTIKVYTTSGRFLRVLGGEGFLPGRFAFPNAVAVALDGRRLYVADSNNQRVQVTDTRGVPLAVITAGHPPAGLKLPRGVAVDQLGRLHVVDTFGQSVHVYDAANRPVLTYGASGGQERLNLPEGIAISEDTIVVSDGGNRRLVVYRY
ncbi:MAG: SMP-30/gluconolactonase/LRE family protein [Thermoleophilia bacterium]|nr:SMP-30/gluconolactonase/LRE family protein [Thermoleophilia bacterium]